MERKLPACHHYHPWMSSTGQEGLVGFARTPEVIGRIPVKHQSFFDEWWLASYKYRAQPNGLGLVELTLLRWIEGDDGKIKNRDRYVQLRDEVTTALGSQ